MSLAWAVIIGSCVIGVSIFTAGVYVNRSIQIAAKAFCNRIDRAFETRHRERQEDKEKGSKG